MIADCVCQSGGNCVTALLSLNVHVDLSLYFWMKKWLGKFLCLLLVLNVQVGSLGKGTTISLPSSADMSDFSLNKISQHWHAKYHSNADSNSWFNGLFMLMLIETDRVKFYLDDWTQYFLLLHENEWCGYKSAYLLIIWFSKISTQVVFIVLEFYFYHFFACNFLMLREYSLTCKSYSLKLMSRQRYIPCPSVTILNATYTIYRMLKLFLFGCWCNLFN